MSVSYKIKFTRNSLSDEFPTMAFLSQLTDSHLSKSPYSSVPTTYDACPIPALGLIVVDVSPLPICLFPGFIQYTNLEKINTQDNATSLWDDVNSPAYLNLDLCSLGNNNPSFVDATKNSIRYLLNTITINPESLTLTFIFEFDTWENLTLFITTIQSAWETESVTKADVQNYLTANNQLIEETFYNNGVETTTDLTCF